MRRYTIRFISGAAAAVLAAAALAGCAGTREETTGGADERTDIVITDKEAAGGDSTAETGTAASEAPDTETPAPEPPGTVVRVGAMSGPTAMGLVKLMDESEKGETKNTYVFADLATDASAFVAPLAKGELDIAAIPSNLAAALYNSTGGGVKALAVCALGVLNLVERGENISGIEDLKGKTVYATGQAAVPEYVIRFILNGNGLDPDKDLELRWCSDTTEALSYITSDDSAIAVLPQPFVTAALDEVEDLRVVCDLNDAWEALDTGCSIATGVIVARSAFAEENAEALETFMSEYLSSASFAAEDPDAAAKLIARYGIVPEELAGKALPGCHVVSLTGDEMRSALSGFLNVLYEQEPESVGGALPGDDFYY